MILKYTYIECVLNVYIYYNIRLGYIFFRREIYVYMLHITFDFSIQSRTGLQIRNVIGD